MSDENEQPPEECECCGFEHIELKPYQHAKPGGGPLERHTVYLCNLCASTHAGSAMEYPRQYEGQAAILKTICYVGNAIIYGTRP